MRGWREDWKKIIRQVIFRDYELRRLMKIPKNTGVIQFTDRYFITETAVDFENLETVLVIKN